MRALSAPLALLGAAAALTLPACATSGALSPRPAPLAFIEDDYPRALAEARARKVPLFIDAWAPW